MIMIFLNDVEYSCSAEFDTLNVGIGFAYSLRYSSLTKPTPITFWFLFLSGYWSHWVTASDVARSLFWVTWP